jgi:hypothetical protein
MEVGRLISSLIQSCLESFPAESQVFPLKHFSSWLQNHQLGSGRTPGSNYKSGGFYTHDGARSTLEINLNTFSNAVSALL